MGVVYKAEDTNLDRTVALKFLAASLLESEEHKQRFFREAKAAASLDHPNICVVYEVGETDGRVFLAMGFIDGPEVKDKIKERPLKLDESLDIAIQAAEGLRAAHQKGVSHRDIKSSNLMLTSTGQVKILDFGLAQLTGATRLTKTETTLGTPAYMSPEQAQCHETDRRTDIWSLGVVLYEMLTGRLPFTGERESAVLHSIISEPHEPITALRAGLPVELDRIVGKALAKKTGERYQHVDDMLVDLRALRATKGDARRSSRGRWLWAALLPGLLTAGYLAWLAARVPDAATSWANATFAQLTDQSGQEIYPNLAADGKSFVYASPTAGNWDIYVQRVGGKNPINLTKDSRADDTQPVFSPDGERIAFRSEREGGGIFVMGGTGESVTRLTDFGYNPAWSPDGKEIVCSTVSFVRPEGREPASGQLFTIRVAEPTGSEKRRITSDGIEDAVHPHWSPHGYRIAYWTMRQGRQGQRDIWTVPAKGGRPIPVTKDAALDWNPVWSPDGRHLYFSSDRGGSMNLWRVPIDERSGKVGGTLEPVTTPSPYSGYISLSQNGRQMLYVQLLRTLNLKKVGFDLRQERVVGSMMSVTQAKREALAPSLSPNGEWIVFSSGGAREDLFLVRPDGTGLSQLTNDIPKDRTPRWSRDGNWIAFSSNRNGNYEIWIVNKDGSGLRQFSNTSHGGAIYPFWSPDGTRLVYSIRGKPYIMAAGNEATTPKDPEAIVLGDELFTARSWSPDGQRLTGHQLSGNGTSLGIAIYDLQSQKLARLTDGGYGAFWLSDSRRVLFVDEATLYLLDTQLKRTHAILTVTPHEINREAIALSRDESLIYFTLEVTEADIWLATLE